MSNERILIAGSKGRIGSLLLANLPNSRGYDAGEFSPELFADIDTFIWAAAVRAWPQDNALEQAEDIYAFGQAIAACGTHNVKRVIYSSSFVVDWGGYDVSADHYDRSDGWDNYYRAAKIAGEAFLHAWSVKTGGIGIPLRIGWYSPGAVTGRADLTRIRHTAEDIIGMFSDAITA